MTIQSTPFTYPTDADDNTQPSLEDARREAMRVIFEWLPRVIVLRDKSGGWASAEAIACRLAILRRLLGVGLERSMAQDAQELGVTRAYMSKVGREMSDALGMRASWQRGEDVRAIYSERAKAVHAGTHVASAKWERRRLREANRK